MARSDSAAMAQEIVEVGPSDAAQLLQVLGHSAAAPQAPPSPQRFGQQIDQGPVGPNAQLGWDHRGNAALLLAALGALRVPQHTLPTLPSQAQAPQHSPVFGAFRPQLPPGFGSY